MGLVAESREREEKPGFTIHDIEQRASWELIESQKNEGDNI